MAAVVRAPEARWRRWQARGGGHTAMARSKMASVHKSPALSNLYGRQFLGAGGSVTRPWKSVSRGGW